MPSLKTMIRKSSSRHKEIQKPQSKNNLPAYDLSLIGSLKYDHEQILNLYDEVLLAAMKKEYPKLHRLLKEFSTALNNHIQVEDEQLYGYLKSLADNKSKSAKKVVNKFSGEMKNISIKIFSFLSQSPCIPVNDSTVDDFIKCFKEVGTELQNRVTHEEKVLYPIYKSSRKVVNIT